MYKVLLSKKAVKDLDKLKRVGLSKKAKEIVESLVINPRFFPCEKHVGNLKGFYSRRINIQNRLVYKIDDEALVVLIVSMWSHCDDN